MYGWKKVSQRMVRILMVFVFLVNMLFSATLPVSADTPNASDVINQIKGLPTEYLGLPLMKGSASEINATLNTASVFDDTSVTFEGMHPVKVTSATGGYTNPTEFGKVFSQPKNLSALTNIELLLWFYEALPETKLKDVRIDLTTNANNFFYLYIDTSSWKGYPGASRIRYNFSQFKKYGNPDITNITKVNLRIAGNTGMVESLGVFDITYNARSKAKVILTFDDGWQDNYDNAFPILEAQGFKGVTYVVSDFAQSNDPNYMRKPTLDLLYNAGWDVSNHSQKHENYLITPGADAPSMGNSFRICQEYLLANGYTRSARFVCYPDGSYDDNLIPYLKNIGAVSARTTRIGNINTPPTDVYKLMQHYIGPNTTFNEATPSSTPSSNDIKPFIDNVIAGGQTLAIMMHRVSLDSQMNTPGDVTNTIKTKVSMLTQVAQYLKDTGVEVCTMSQWYQELQDGTTALKLASKTAVAAARTAYNALDPAQKALVTNYAILTDAEAKITQLQEEALQKTITEIDALPTLALLSLSDKAAITTARTNYDLLTPTQQLGVTNYDKLLNLEAKISLLENIAVDAVLASILAIPEDASITLADKPTVTFARAQYDALPNDLKPQISNYSVLQTAEAVIANLTIAQIVTQIDGLPTNYAGIPLMSADFSEFTFTTNANPLIRDTSVNYLGASPIKITSTTGGGTVPTVFGKTYAQALDLSRLTKVELLLWFYEPNPLLSIRSFRVDLATTSNSYYYKYIDSLYIENRPGFQRISLDLNQFIPLLGSSPSMSSIKTISLRLKGQDGKYESVGVFSINYNTSGALTATPRLSLLYKPLIDEIRISYNSLSSSSKSLVTNYGTFVDAEAKVSQLNQAISLIKGYTTTHNASALTIAQMTNLGIINATESNLSRYQSAIALSNPTDISSESALQAIVDGVNAATPTPVSTPTPTPTPVPTPTRYSISIDCLTTASMVITGDPIYDENMNEFGKTTVLAKTSYLATDYIVSASINTTSKSAILPPLPAGNYVLAVSRIGYLSRYISVTLSDESLDLGDKSILAGDISGDGIIDGSDSETLFTYLGSSYGDLNYIHEYDLNLDGIVDGSDTELVFANIGTATDDYGETVNYFQ